MVTFLISTFVPGDPVEVMLKKENSVWESKNSYEKAYKERRHTLYLDLPVFYFSLSNKTFSDTLHRIPNKFIRKNLERLAYKYGNWENVSSYYTSWRELVTATDHEKVLIEIKEKVLELGTIYQEESIKTTLEDITETFKNEPSEKIRMRLNLLESAFEMMRKNPKIINRYIPKLVIHGFSNQYHIWLFGDKPWFGTNSEKKEREGIMRGDFGISYTNGKPITKAILEALPWTLLISIASIILAYLIAVPLGVLSAARKHSFGDRVIGIVVLIFYSLPEFWIACLLITFLCGGDYLDWFPAFGVSSVSETASVFHRFFDTAHHLFLPVLCCTYPTVAFIVRQTRNSMINTLNQDYIRTANAKGLNEQYVLWKHAFKNASLPIITLFASVFPLVVMGSFITEFIFTIPGVGKLSYDALMTRNYPVIFSVTLLISFFTLVGSLVADILYALIDPRISFSKTKR